MNGREPADAAIGAEPPGTVIGRYRLVRAIGEGGFGTVHLAEQTEPVRREVALKILKLGMDTRAVVSRFEAERRALALMEHPSIARVLDAGATDRGRPYFVMELVRGKPIVEFCDQRKLSPSGRLALFIDVCLGVQHAHTKGIIHRDLKPSNILVAEADGRALAKVIDFGIAKATGPLLNEHTALTEAQQLVGTPAYMSPEQADDASGDIDTRSDIYSLGVLLYELLTGATPFKAEALRAAGWVGMRRMIREDDPPRPSSRVSGEGGRSSDVAAQRSTASWRLESLLRGDLDWIVMRCLEKDRARRYQTAEALAQDVRRHLSGEPVLAAPPSLRYRAGKFFKRNRAGVIGAGVAVLALAGGVGGVIAGLTEARAGRAAAQVQADRAQRIAEFLRTTMAGIGPGVAMGRDTKLLRGVMQEAEAKIKSGQISDNPEAEVELRVTIGDVYRQLGDEAAAIAMLEPALELAERLWPGDHPLKAECLDRIGSVPAAHGDKRWVRSEQHARAALEMRRRLYVGDHPAVATSINNVGWAYAGLHRMDEAQAAYAEALEMRRRLYSGDHPDVAISLHNLGAVLSDRGRMAEAEPLLRESLAMHEKLHPPEHPSVATAMYSLAKALERRGELDASEALYRRVLETRRATYEGDHILTAQVFYPLASVLIVKGRCDEAEPLIREGRAMSVRLGQEARTWDRMMCECLISQGRLEEAEVIAREMATVAAQNFPGNTPQRAAELGRLGLVLLYREKLDECERVTSECLEIRRTVYKKDHIDVVLALVNLAACLDKQGRRSEALERAREAAEIAGRLPTVSPNSRKRIESLFDQLGMTPDGLKAETPVESGD